MDSQSDRPAGDGAAERNRDPSESVAHSNCKPRPVHDASGRIVAQVVGDVCEKTVSASQHQLRHPPAWSFDIASLEEAEAAGARWVVLRDSETGEVWRATVASIWATGFHVDRGHGQQMALALRHWETKGDQALQQMALF